jgi:outer membrane protein assembly factor BamB
LLTIPTLVAAVSPEASPAGEARWPQFRGPAGSGVGASDFPVHFGPQQNLLWKSSVPPGHSSPCIWDDRIFLTGFEKGKLAVACLSRSNGGLLWQRQCEPGEIERGARLSDPATATPATDGVHVFVYFGSLGLLAFDFSGNEIWRKPLPVPVTQHGPGTSPVLAGDLLLLSCDQDVGSHLLAVKKADGSTIWKAERPGFRRGFSTPLPWPPDRPEQVILPGTMRLVSYNLTDGTERWSASGLPNEMVASPTAGDGLIFVAGWTFGSGVSRMPEFEKLLAEGDASHDGRLTREEAPAGPARQHFPYIDADKDGAITREEYAAIARIFDESKNVAMAVRPDGRGDVTATHVVWQATRGLPYVPSPLYYDGRLHLVRNGGMASCLDAKTGEYFYRDERLGPFGDYYASPVAAAGKICAASQPGVIVIYRAGPKLEVLAQNDLKEQILATPAIADGKLYVRTLSALYAFGEK